MVLKDYVGLLDEIITHYETQAECCGQEGDDFLFEELIAKANLLSVVRDDIKANYNLHTVCHSLQFVNLLNEKEVLEVVQGAVPYFVRKIDDEIKKLQELKAAYNSLVTEKPTMPKGGWR